jgi:steroid delta-isomerase-like uncharacterized protein
MNTNQNKQIVRDKFAKVDNNDFDAVRKILADGFEATVNGGDTMTAEAFEAMGRGITSAFSNGRHNIHRQLCEGDWVASDFTWTAIHSGEFNGVPASNRPVRVACKAFDRIENGKVAEHHTMIDMMGLMAQIGAIPVPA